jgi:hypothetical protein
MYKIMQVNFRWADLGAWTVVFAGVYLAVLPMADTIALRNLALFGLLLCVAFRFSEVWSNAHTGPFAVLWAAYLLVFPLIATDTQTAWVNLCGQWGRGLLAMIVGVGSAVILRERRISTTFYLGLASGVPLLVHLWLFIGRGLEIKSIPWGYWGRESHHADLGYAACHVVVLAMVSLLAGHRRYRIGSIALVVVSVLSPVLAQSRAGLLFALLSGIFVFAMHYAGQAVQLKRSVLALSIVAVGGLTALSFTVDARWHTLTDKLAAGLLGDALQIECEGTTSIEQQILTSLGPGSNSVDVINAVRDGDGARIVLFRAGLELAQKNPMGSDGSRQAFKQLLRKVCPNPVISMAHTHNGWIDTMLAIGWLGAGLYFSMLLYLIRLGVKSANACQHDHGWGLALTALSLFWLLRGFTDSVFRDHMLEMQGFILMFATTSAQMLEDRRQKTDLQHKIQQT